MLIDDLDGSEADESITFGLGGTEYEIDLSKPHADQLRAALEPFVNAGTKLTPHRVTGRTGYARTPARADRGTEPGHPRVGPVEGHGRV